MSIGRLSKFLAGEDLNPDEVIREKREDKMTFEGQVRSLRLKSHEKSELLTRTLTILANLNRLSSFIYEYSKG